MSHQKNIVLHVDYGDMLLIAKEENTYYGYERIAKLMEMSAKSGITHIYWRVSMIGASNYPGKIRYQLNDLGAKNINLNEPYPHPFTVIGDVYSKVVDECDPLEAAAKLAHENGLKFYPYVTLFDESYPGIESKFVQENPECCWQHRYYPDKRIPGLLSYAYEEVVEYRLSEIKELLTYDIDGIYLDTARTHCGVWDISALPFGNYSPYLNYGFNDPEVSEYEKRYGVNPRLSNLADAVLPEQIKVLEDGRWDRLRGEYMTGFLGKASQLIKEKEGSVASCVYTDADSYLSPAGQRGRAPLGHFYHDWENWAEQGIIDELVLVAGDHRRFGVDDWNNHSAKQFSAARKDGLNVYCWAGTEKRIDELPSGISGQLPLHIEDNRKEFLDAMREALKECLELDTEGVFLHEAWDIEKYDYFNVVEEVFNGIC
ncbi:MAG: family 10 glycosylhydrolase [Planctomycetota bacterium]|jgi:uncharacterized lipoprotein YddW (UPF0748 family)